MSLSQLVALRLGCRLSATQAVDDWHLIFNQIGESYYENAKIDREARASTRSIFNLALIGALLAFAGHAFGQAEELSGYCKWPADWDADAMGVQPFNELEAVDGNTYTIRFNGAVGDAAEVRERFASQHRYAIGMMTAKSTNRQTTRLRIAMRP